MMSSQVTYVNQLHRWKTSPFHHLNPSIDTKFTEIDDRAAISEIANAPISITQKMNENKTRVIFSAHFCESHKALRCTGSLTLTETINRNQGIYGY